MAAISGSHMEMHGTDGPVPDEKITPEQEADRKRQDQLSQMNIAKDGVHGVYKYYNPNGSEPVTMKDENGNDVKDSATALRVASNYTGDNPPPVKTN